MEVPEFRFPRILQVPTEGYHEEASQNLEDLGDSKNFGNSISFSNFRQF